MGKLVSFAYRSIDRLKFIYLFMVWACFALLTLVVVLSFDRR
jgi:hypothetical protein